MSELSAEQRKETITALVRERSFLGSDVEAIDRELARLGHDARAPQKRAVKMTKPKGVEL